MLLLMLPLQVTDPAAHRCFTIAKQGFPDAVLWNPHIAKAQSMSDFGDDEWPGMVCLEPAVAASGPVVLQPGQMWTAGQQLSVSAV